MPEEEGPFASLFRKYRLKAEFATLSELGLALAEKGLIYEDSIFSHWQKGTRIPQSRNILIRLIEIFVQRRAITTIGQANEFLTSAHQGYLSEEEISILPLPSAAPVFQVPNEIANFCGREEIIRTILQTDLSGKIILLHGPAGVGKTALAIKLGHLLKDRFRDGVLWYKVEEDNLRDILISVLYLLDNDMRSIQSTGVLATLARTMMAHKQLLLFLDNGDSNNDFHLLIPNSTTCAVIITSRKEYLKEPIRTVNIPVQPFSHTEALKFCRCVLVNRYTAESIKNLFKLEKGRRYLPHDLYVLIRGFLQERRMIPKYNTGKNGSIGTTSSRLLSFRKPLFQSKTASELLSANYLLLLHYSCMALWWGILFVQNVRGIEANTWYQIAYTSMPLIWGFEGLKKSFRWGNNYVGRALFYTSCGLVSWGIGQLLWSVLYNLLLRIEIPYPSLADFGYVASIPLWIMGAMYLTKATGITISRETIKNKTLLFTIPIGLILFSYYLLVMVARDGVISDWQGGYAKVFLDFAYPMGDMIILFLSVLAYGLSFSQLRGRHKTSVLTIFLGFIAMFFADFSFSYTTTQGTYYNGHWIDILFPTALTIISMGINSFSTPRKNMNYIRQMDHHASESPLIILRKLFSTITIFSPVLKRS